MYWSPSPLIFIILFKVSVADPDPYVLGLLDPDPDLLVRGLDPDPYIIKQNSKKNLYSFCFVTFFFDFLSLKNDVNVPSKSNKQENFFEKISFLLTS